MISFSYFSSVITKCLTTPLLRSAGVLLLVASLITSQFTTVTTYALDDATAGFFATNGIHWWDPDAVPCSLPALTASGSTNVTANTSSVSTGFTLGTDNSMRPVNLARQLMADFGLTDAQAAGIVGNFMHESGGSYVPPNINQGGFAGPPRFSGGYGWAQWTGARQHTFIDYAIQNGYMASTQVDANDAANYAYLKYELISVEKGTIPAVKAATTAAAAATAFEANFERAGVPALEKRIAFANQLVAAMQGGTGITGTESTTASSSTPGTGLTSASCALQAAGAAALSATFGQVVFPLQVSKSDIKNGSIFQGGTTSRGGHPYIAFDIYAAAGTTVLAFINGTISQVKADGSMGGYVTIYDSTSNTHVYSTHLHPDPSLQVGQQITAGTPIGTLVSVAQYPSINTDHLHIDAGVGNVREGCSRTNPNGAACNNRLDIGPDLYEAWLTLPLGVGNEAV